MDFIDHLRTLASRATKQAPLLATEEATKNALVMPFINALGYNVFDPLEVTPEFNADVGIKKGEKVDYAILKDGEAVMLFECKQVSADLDKINATQLFRYFSVAKARVGILTNGIIYRFFSDLDEPNKLDSRPFLEFDLFNFDDADVAELKKLTKPHFDQDAVLEAASELKHTREVKRFLAEQLASPDENFMRIFIDHVYPGRVTQAVRDQFKPIVKNAFKQFVLDQVNDRLKSALQRDVDDPAPTAGQTVNEDVTTTPKSSDDGIVTTEEELEGFHIVKAILREHVESSRIVARDVKSYFGILLDDTNRKPLARLHFNSAQKYIGLFDSADKKEERVPIQHLDDIYRLADRLWATVLLYEETQEA